MAQWRVSLGLTQNQVVQLADQINYLGNTGPTTAANITDVVTRVGSLGQIAGFTAADVAALGSTIGSAGIQSEVAATAIKKVFTTLASGQKMTKDQKKAMKFLHLNPKTLASDLQKNGKAALENVFTQLSKVAPDKRVAVLKTLFGEESVGAIAPLLANLSLLKTNFNRVADSAQYAGSMQKEYSSRAGTTANQLELLKNNLNRISVNTGDALLPALSDGLQQAMPVLDSISDFVKSNPEIVKMAAGAAAGLTAIGGMAAISMLVAAAGPIGILLGALVGAGTYIVSHWGDIQKLINDNQEDTETYKSAKKVTEAYGFGKNTNVTPFVQDPFGFNQQRVLPAANQMGVIGGGINVIPYAWMDAARSLRQDMNAATGRFPEALTSWKNAPAYNYRAPTGQEMLTGAKAQLQGELVVRFDGAPPGMRVSDGKTNAPGVRVVSEVGYNRFSSQNLFRTNQ